jgi:hypothetical protein
MGTILSHPRQNLQIGMGYGLDFAGVQRVWRRKGRAIIPLLVHKDWSRIGRRTRCPCRVRGRFKGAGHIEGDVWAAVPDS